MPFDRKEILGGMGLSRRPGGGWGGGEPLDVDPFAQVVGSYDEFLTWAMQLGMTRQEARSQMSQARYSQLGSEGAQEALGGQQAPGYKRYRKVTEPAFFGQAGVPSEKRSYLKPYQWTQMPEHLRQRFLHSVHASVLPQSDYGDIEVPSGQMLRKDEARAFKTEPVLSASYLGVSEQGVSHTFETGKFHKRIQMLGAHPTVGISGAPSFTAPVPAGPGAKAPDVFTPLRGAFIIGGEPGPPGQGYIEKSLGEVRTRIVREYEGEEWEPEPAGTEWKHGKKVRLAPGMAGFRSQHWGHRLLDTFKVPTGEGTPTRHRAVLERFAPLEKATMAFKMGAVKTLAAPTDLSAISSATTGQDLGIQYLGSLKDVGGYAYLKWVREFQGKSPQEIGRALGAPGPIASFGGMPPEIRQRYIEARTKDIQTIDWPQRVHKDQLEYYEPVTVGEPRKVRGQPEMRVITTRYQAAVGDVGMQGMMEYGPQKGQEFINFEDLDELRRSRPRLAADMEERGFERRAAAGDIINAQLATQGRNLPPGAVQVTDPKLRELMLTASQQAAVQAREIAGVGPNEPISRRLVSRQWWDLMGKGQAAQRATVWGAGKGRLVTPPWAALSKHQATKPEGPEGEEISQYLNRMQEMAMLNLGGELGEPYFEAMGVVREKQKEMVEGKSGKTTKRAMGVFPSGLISGAKAMSSPGLGTQEVYVPGRGGQAVSMFRYPTSPIAWRPSVQARAITRETAIQRGMSPHQMYVSPQLQQMLRGDYDADIDYALSSGMAMLNKESNWTDSQGRELSPTDVKKMGAVALMQGAQKLIEEYVGQGQPAPSLAKAKQMFMEGAKGSTVPFSALEQEAEKGRQMYADIPKYYQTLGRRVAATLPKGDVMARHSQQMLHDLSHVPAQQPKELSDPMQKIQDLFTVTPGRGMYYRGAGKTGAQTGPAHYMGLLTESNLAMTQLLTAKRGEQMITPEIFAGAMAPEGNREEVLELAREVKEKGKGVEDAPRLLQSVLKSVGGSAVRWGLEGGALGRGYGAHYAGKVAREVVPDYKGWEGASAVERKAMVRQLGIRGGATEKQALQLMQRQDLQRAYTTAFRKGGPIEEYAQAVELLQSAGIDIPIDLVGRGGTAADAEYLQGLGIKVFDNGGFVEGMPGERVLGALKAGELVFSQQDAETVAEIGRAAQEGLPLAQEHADFLSARAGAAAVPQAASPSDAPSAGIMPVGRKQTEQEAAAAFAGLPANAKQLSREAGAAAIGGGSGGRKPPPRPPVEVPGWMREDPGYGGTGTPGSPPARSAGGGSRWGQPDAPWVSNKQLEQLEFAKGQLQKWGESVGRAIESTDEINSAQGKFLKRFATYQTAHDKLSKTVEQMEGELMRQPHAAPAWQRRQTRRLGEARTALDELYTERGFGAMGRAQGAVAMREEEALIAQGEGGGPDVAPGGPGQKAFGRLLQEFSIGGAYFRMMAVNRLLGQPVQQWGQKATELGQAQIGFGMAMGGAPEAAMGTPLGRIAAYQAQVGGFQAGMGESALMSQAGLVSMMPGEGPSYALGRGVGGIVTPAMTGARIGLTAGIIAGAAGQVGRMGLAEATAAGTAPGLVTKGLVGLGRLAGPITGVVMAATAAALYAGEAYEMAAPENIQRELIERQQGLRKDLSVGARVGLGLRGEDIPIRPGGRGAALSYEATTGGMRLGEAEKKYLGGLSEATINVLKAQVYLTSDKLDIMGVGPEGKLRLGGMLEFAGAEAGDIAAGRWDERLRKMAPLEMTGMTQEAMTSMLGVSGALGIAPGKGMAPYMDMILEGGMSRAGLSRTQMAAGVIGQAGAMAGVTPGTGVIQQYAQQMEAGVPEWQLQLRAQATYGVLPIVRGMGLTPGSPGAQAVSNLAAPAWGTGSAMVSGRQPTEVPSGQYYVSPLRVTAASGTRRITPGQAEMQAQVASEFGGIADVMGLGLEDRVGYFAGLEQERRGRQVQYAPGQFRWEAPTPQAQMRQQQAAAGIGGEAFGFRAGTEEGMEFMRGAPTINVKEANLFAETVSLAGPVGQMLGYDPAQARAQTEQFMDWRRGGAAPAALGIVAQQQLGTGALSQALGLPYGFGGAAESLTTGGLTTGAMTAQQYTTLAAGAGYGQQPMGYSMMIAAQRGQPWGIGQELLEQREGAGLPVPQPGAEPPYVKDEQGRVYGRYQREQFATQWAQRLGGAAPGADGKMVDWSTQTLPEELGGRTYQMGLPGQTQQAVANLQLYNFTQPLRRQQFELQYQGQRANIANAMESATLQFQQAQESLGLRQEMWQTRTRFQRQEFGFGYQQMQQGQEWGREDFAFGRQQAGLQFGWQMEDYDRSIRFATGREKEQLIRQRGRAEEMYTIEEGRRGTEEERQETVWTQEEERFARRVAHFEEINALEAQQFEMQQSHLEQSYAMQMRHLAGAKGRLEENYSLSKQIFDAEEAHQLAQLERGVALALQQEKVAASTKEFEQALMDLTAWMTGFFAVAPTEIEAKPGLGPLVPVGKQGEQYFMEDEYPMEEPAAAEGVLGEDQALTPELVMEIALAQQGLNKDFGEFIALEAGWVEAVIENYTALWGEEGLIQTNLAAIEQAWIDGNAAADAFFDGLIGPILDGGSFVKAWEDFYTKVEELLLLIEIPGAVEPTGQYGGTIFGDQAILVGEKGPELFVPGSSGYLLPNHRLGQASIGDAFTGKMRRGSIGNITVQVTVPPGQYDEHLLGAVIASEIDKKVGDLAERHDLRGESW